MGRSLFRYRSIDSKNYSLCALKNDQVWATNPNFFNDPFDCAFSYDLDIVSKLLYKDDEFIDEFISDYMDSDDYKNSKDKDSFEEIKSIIFNHFVIFKKWIKNILDESITLIRNMQIIACFSQHVNNEVMWANYSDNGKGFALEYDEEYLESLAELYKLDFNWDKYPSIYIMSSYGLKDVNYEKSKFDGTHFICTIIRYYYKRLKFCKEGLCNKMYLPRINPDEFNFIFLNKNEKWLYEDEVRLILPNNLKDEHKSIGICKPKAVYLGKFIKDEDKFNILYICKEKNIKVFQMETSFGTTSFGLYPKQISQEDVDHFILEYKRKKGDKKCIL